MITTLGFAYISSDVGMGKTAVAAALILKLLEKRKAEQVGQAPGSSGFRLTYKPTLVLIPRDGMLSLFDDLKAFPDITAHQWYGPPETAIADRAIGTSVEALIARLNDFDQHDPVTALQVVVTTYTKYRTMATYFEGAFGVYNTKGKGKAVNLPNHADEFGEEEEEDEDNSEEYDGKYQNLMCHVKGRFGLIILDQVHKVKNPLTRTHVSISKSCPDQLLGLTSTPIMQSPADLLGYIKLAWQVAASRELVGETSVHPSRNSYDPLAEQLIDASIADLPAFLPILHPASYKTHLGYSTCHRELVSSVEHVQQIVRPILHICFLRFYKGQDLTPFGLNEVAGGGIPRYKSLVMEMQYDECQQREHEKAFKALIKDRGGFIASFHPKWGFLAGALHEVLYERNSKLLVFVSSPFTHHILDNLLGCLGIQYVSINSAVEMDNRDKAYKSFNDPGHATSVMTVHTNLGCAAFQAQRACHITVLLDFPAFPSPRLFDQLIGRTWRMGQEQSPIFITVTSNATFDHILQGVFAHKAILQTAVLGNIPTKCESAVEDANADGDQNEAAQDLTNGHIEAEEHQDEHHGERMEEEVGADDAVRKDTDLFIAKATSLYMKALGLSSSRMGWDRASCEQFLRDRKRAKKSRADSVIEPDVEGETGRSEARPLVVDDDNDSSSSEEMCQDVDEGLGKGPPAAEATSRRKRAANRQPENPAKRQPMEGEASSSK
ncbi:P-loop containing nucleoside triphosphate hydrolase protein [Phyllosticta citrichinensis]